MIEQLTQDDQDLLRRATDSFNQGQAVLNFIAGYLKDKYGLQDFDKILPNGEIQRAEIPVTPLTEIPINGTM